MGIAGSEAGDQDNVCLYNGLYDSRDYTSSAV